MLESLRIRGFRAIKDLELTFPPGKPLVLIGENGSGKSTILDAVSLLCAVASGNGAKAIADRGGWQAVSWCGGTAPIELTVRLGAATPELERDGGPAEYSVRLESTRGLARATAEEVRVFKRGVDEKPFSALGGGARPWVANRQTKQNESTPSDALGVALGMVVDEERYPSPVHVKRALQSMAFYPAFRFAPTSDEGGRLGGRPLERTPRIHRSGHDLLTALHTLSQEHPREWAGLLDDVRAVFPWLTHVTFPAGSGRGLVDLRWIDSRTNATLYLDDTSEGTRVFLALSAALHAPERAALLAFDEPERSLHPRAVRRFVRRAESCAEQAPLIIATHSDRLLDYVEQPADVLRVVRFSNTEGVVAEQLERALVEDWLRDYSMSELRARDMLDGPSEGQ